MRLLHFSIGNLAGLWIWIQIRIVIDLAMLDANPDPHREYRTGSKSNKIDTAPYL